MTLHTLPAAKRQIMPNQKRYDLHAADTSAESPCSRRRPSKVGASVEFAVTNQGLSYHGDLRGGRKSLSRRVRPVLALAASACHCAAARKLVERVVQQYQRGVHFRLGRVIGVREPVLRLIIPIIDRLWRVSMCIVTMPIQSQGIITRDNVKCRHRRGCLFPCRRCSKIRRRHRKCQCCHRSNRTDHVAQRRRATIP
jgi:hypothetical protein